MTVADVDWKVLEGMGCRWHLDGMGKYLMGRENFGLDGRRMRMQRGWDGKIFDGTENFGLDGRRMGMRMGMRMGWENI